MRSLVLPAVLTVLTLATVASTAPVPKGGPPARPRAAASVALGTATADGERVTVYDLAGGATVAYHLPASATCATTAGGKVLTPDELAERLGAGAAVVVAAAGFYPEWRKAFADDAIVLEHSPVPPGR